MVFLSCSSILFFFHYKAFLTHQLVLVSYLKKQFGPFIKIHFRYSSNKKKKSKPYLFVGNSNSPRCIPGQWECDQQYNKSHCRAPQHESGSLQPVLHTPQHALGKAVRNGDHSVLHFCKIQEQAEYCWKRSASHQQETFKDNFLWFLLKPTERHLNYVGIQLFQKQQTFFPI